MRRVAGDPVDTGDDPGERPAAGAVEHPDGDQARLLGDAVRSAAEGAGDLLTEHTAGRFAFHDLLRAYATELAHDVEPQAERRAAARRALDHYLRTAYAADQLLNPERDRITLPPAGPGVTPEEHADRGQAMAWFGAEHRVLLAAADRAAATGLDIHAWQLPWVLADFFNLRGHSHDLGATQHAALEAARRLADRQAQAHIHLNIGSVLGRQGRQQEALEHAQRAHELYRAAGRDDWRVRALDAVGWLYAQLGDHHQALAYCRQVLALHQEVGDRDELGHPDAGTVRAKLTVH